MPNAISNAGRQPEARAAPRLFISASVDQVVLVASVYWMLAANWPFFDAALDGRSALDPATWGFAAALATMLVALHVLLLALVANRWTLKPLLSVLLVGTAVATYFMRYYGVYLDPSMMRNVLHTDVHESRELLSWTLAVHLLLYAGLPLALLWRVRLDRPPWRRALLVRLGVLLVAAATAVGALLAIFQPFSALMRNHREMRYLITPANYLWSTAQVVRSDSHDARRPRQPIGLDAAPGASWAHRSRPMILVLVVGETARAANWGLDGYARQTTPQLARLPVVNFPHATSCGTSTEVSLPCMFAPVGRRDYDEARIRGSESLLHVLARAGVGVYWLDNQSGCKGVCDGLPHATVGEHGAPGLCSDDGCLDEALLRGLDKRLAAASGTQIIVLHQRGNHGPAYFRRYPKAFAHFRPACEDDALQHCTRQQIVNAYDNALLYTDHVLASLIAKLQAQAAYTDSAMIYVSDHGESLGEDHLFLHGMPYAIAPSQQTHIPMLMWMSAGFAHARAIDMACLQRRADEPVSHDNLFHTVLGLLDVRTSIYVPGLDLTRPCRPTGAPRAAQ